MNTISTAPTGYPRKPWSQDEDAILKRLYPTHGVAGVQAALEAAGSPRSAKAIRDYASRALYYQGELPGHVRVRDMSWGPGDFDRILAAAKSEGVLKTVRGKTRYLVPADWADAYMKQEKGVE